MSFPLHLAEPLVVELDKMASAGGANVFVGPIHSDPHGENYRSVTVDITRHDWGRLRPKLVSCGWRTFGDGVAHPLSGDHYIVALPSF